MSVENVVSTTVHIGDTGKEIALLSLTEKGAYYEIRRLLAGAGGFVPDDPERIKRAIGADSDEWKRVWPHIEHLFPVVDGRRHHPATLEDIQFRQARREAGRKGGQQPHPTQRTSKGRAEVERQPEQESSNSRADDRAKVDPPSPSPSPDPNPQPSPEPEETETCPAGPPAGPGAAGEAPALELVPDEPRTRREAKPNDWSNILRVLDHYRKHHPRSFPKPNPKAKEAVAIAARLRDGKTVEELCQCIDGYHRSPHHLGHNDRHTKYLSLELFMRDESHVNAGIEFAKSPPARDRRHGRFPIEDIDWSKVTTGEVDLDTGLPPLRRDPRIGACRADEQDHSVTGEINLGGPPRSSATPAPPPKDPDRYRKEAEADIVAAAAVTDLVRGLAVAKGAS